MVELMYRGELYEDGSKVELYEGILGGVGRRLIRRYDDRFYYKDNNGKLQLIREPVLVPPQHLTLTTEGK